MAYSTSILFFGEFCTKQFVLNLFDVCSNEIVDPFSFHVVCDSVIIAMASSMPQFFPQQGFPQQTANPFFQNQPFPNQNFQGQTFPNQGFTGQLFPNQGFQGQAFPNQG